MMVEGSSKGGKRRRGAACVLACVGALGVGMLANGAPQPAADSELVLSVRGFEKAIQTKDLAGALAAWQFESADDRDKEESALRGVFSAENVVFRTDTPALGEDGRNAATMSTLAQISEPRGAIEQWGLLWRKTDAGWRIVSRRTFGGLDGLLHLELQPEGYVANGQTIELEDFTLKMTRGTFFLNTAEAGPTALVFVGKGRVTFRPRPPTERGQMVLFAKKEFLEDDVSQAFLRLHPADLYRTLQPGTFERDPAAPKVREKAREYFDRHKTDSFILDAPIAGAPWWLLPGLGDAAIVFDTRRYGSLTLSLSSFEEEGVSLFDRRSRRQISVYPRAGISAQAGAGPGAIDVLHHDLTLSLDPDTFNLGGRDALQLEVKAPLSSFRFHLSDDLRVTSVRSEEGGRHLFFRVRGQNSVLVSMGSLSGRMGRLHLTVEYEGRLPTGTVDSENLQAGQALVTQEPITVFIDPALIYTRRSGFYPEIGDEDYATSILSVTVPAEWTVVSGGVRTESGDRDKRTFVHAQNQPAKYLAFMAARLLPVGGERTEALDFDAFAQPRVRRDAVDAIADLKSAAAFFARLFGPLPYTPLTLALVEAPVPGGHAPPGLIVLQERPPLMGGSLRDDPATFYDIRGFFLAHELAHQWWGHAITPRTYRDRWLSEGFAQYAAALWARESEGEETFVKVLRKMATWARRKTGAGPVSLGNRVGHIRNDPQAHRAVVYDKGALVLDMVRRLIGDEAFARGLLRLQWENRFEKAETETVRKAFEAESGRSLEELWDTFVRSPALPSMRLQGSQGRREVMVEGYAGPLPVEVRLDDRRFTLIVTGRTPIPGDAPGVKIALDPDRIGLVEVR